MSESVSNAQHFISIQLDSLSTKYEKYRTEVQLGYHISQQ